MEMRNMYDLRLIWRHSVNRFNCMYLKVSENNAFMLMDSIQRIIIPLLAWRGMQCSNIQM